MIINIALWTDPSLFGVFGNDLRNTWSNPFINTFVKVGGTVLDGLPGMADLRDASSARSLVVGAALLPGRAARASSTRSGRGRRGDRRGGHRLATRRRTDVSRRTEVLRGELHDELVAAMQKVPGAGRPGADAHARCRAASRTATSWSTRPARTERWVIRLAGNDTHLLGISREVEHAATVAAAGVGRRARR